MNPRSMIRGIAPILICAAVLSACGSSSSSASDVPSLNGTSKNGSATTTTVDPVKAVQDFVTCARAQGLSVADPKVGADGQVDLRSLFQGSDVQPGSDTFRNVQAKCGDKLRNAGFGPNAADQKERQAAQLAFTACLRKQGLTVGDLPTGGGPGFGGRGNGDGGGAGAGAGGSSTTVAGGSATPTTVAGGAGGTGNGGNFRPPQTAEEREQRLAERLSLDISDPKVSAAFKSCSKELAAITQGFGGRGTTTTTAA